MLAVGVFASARSSTHTLVRLHSHLPQQHEYNEGKGDDLARTHEHAAHQHEDPADRVPGLVDAELGDHAAVEQHHDADENDERQQAHGRVERTVAAHEGEEGGDVVDGDEAARVGGRHGHEQQHGLLPAQEGHGEHAVTLRREPRGRLLHGEGGHEHPRQHEERDDLPAAPGVVGAAEVDGHDEADEGGGAQDGAGVVELAPTQPQGLGAAARVETGQQEDVDGRDQAADDQGAVEGPPPRGRGLREGAADDRADDGPDAEDDAAGTQSSITARVSKMP